MVRSELVRKISAAHPHLAPEAVRDAIDAILAEILTSLGQGHKVQLRSFAALGAFLPLTGRGGLAGTQGSASRCRFRQMTFLGSERRVSCFSASTGMIGATHLHIHESKNACSIILLVDRCRPTRCDEAEEGRLI